MFSDKYPWIYAQTVQQKYCSGVTIQYFLQVWRGCKLRIFAIAEQPEKNDEMKRMLQKYIYMLRIDAAVFVNISYFIDFFYSFIFALNFCLSIFSTPYACKSKTRLLLEIRMALRRDVLIEALYGRPRSVQQRRDLQDWYRLGKAGVSEIAPRKLLTVRLFHTRMAGNCLLTPNTNPLSPPSFSRFMAAFVLTMFNHCCTDKACSVFKWPKYGEERDREAWHILLKTK